MTEYMPIWGTIFSSLLAPEHKIVVYLVKVTNKFIEIFCTFNGMLNRILIYRGVLIYAKRAPT